MSHRAASLDRELDISPYHCGEGVLLHSGRDGGEELVLLLRGLHNQISSSAHSSVV